MKIERKKVGAHIRVKTKGVNRSKLFQGVIYSPLDTQVHNAAAFRALIAYGGS